MWQQGTVHPTHNMAAEISHVAEINDGNTLYAEELEIEYGGSNARHGAAIGYAVEEENGLALMPDRAVVDVRSGNQDPEQIGYDDSLAWNQFGDEPATDLTTMDSQIKSATAVEVNKFMLWGSFALGAWWLWSRR